MSLLVTLLLLINSFLLSLVNGQLTFNTNVLITMCDANIDAITFQGGTCGTFTLLNNQYTFRSCSTSTFQLSPSGAVGSFPTFSFPVNDIVIISDCTATSFGLYYVPGVNCGTTQILNGDVDKISNMTKVIHVKY